MQKHLGKLYPQADACKDVDLTKGAGHCIEALRRSLMCSADTSLRTYRWEERNAVRPLPKSNAQRVCKNWGDIEGWVTDRHVPLTPTLMRPMGDEDTVLMKRDETDEADEDPLSDDPSFEVIQTLVRDGRTL